MHTCRCLCSPRIRRVSGQRTENTTGNQSKEAELLVGGAPVRGGAPIGGRAPMLGGAPMRGGAPTSRCGQQPANLIRWAAVAPISHNHYEFVWPAVAASSV